MISIQWPNGREVRNPFLRPIVFVVWLAWVIIVILALVLGLMLVTPLLVPFHLIFRMLGRRGFIRFDDDGSVNFQVDRTSFDRKP